MALLATLLMLAGAVLDTQAQDTTATVLAPAKDGKGAGIDPLQKLYRHNRRGNQAFVENEIEEALKEYVEAQAVAPNDSRVLYNMGNSLAKQGKTEDALAMLERAAQETELPELERDARYNRGILQMGDEDLQGALRSFGEALTIDPTDADARRNLELVLKKLQEQEEQEQQQDQQEDQEQQQNDQQQDQDHQDDEQENQQQNQDRQSPQDQEHQDQQQPQPRDPSREQQREAARRLLKALENAEKQELKKAVQQQIPNLKDRKEDW